MRELWTARTLSNRPNIRCARLEAAVHRDISVGVKANAGELQSDPVRIGDASSRDQQIAGFDSLITRGRMQPEADSLPGPTLHADNLGAEMYQDAFVAQHLQ